MLICVGPMSEPPGSAANILVPSPKVCHKSCESMPQCVSWFATKVGPMPISRWPLCDAWLEWFPWWYETEPSSPSLFHAVTLEHFLYMPTQMNFPTLTHLSSCIQYFHYSGNDRDQAITPLQWHANTWPPPPLHPLNNNPIKPCTECVPKMNWNVLF